MFDDDWAAGAAPSQQEIFLATVKRRFQTLLDKSVVHTGPRWVGAGLGILAMWWRVQSLQGYYLVFYALGIYLLKVLVGFLSPQVSAASPN